MIFDLPKFGISYSLIPFKRNQDVIKVFEFNKNIKFTTSIVDGYSNKDKLKGNGPGREVATFVADNFPEEFIKINTNNYQKKAEETSIIIDKKVLKLYPAYAGGVGAFLFDYKNQDVVVALESIYVYYWNGHSWDKPEEIGDYSLDLKKYPSDVSRFFGIGELKKQSPDFYMAKPDTVIFNPKCPIFIGTDGIEELLSVRELNNYTQKIGLDQSEKLIKTLSKLILSRRNLQNDDASIFIKL